MRLRALAVTTALALAATGLTACTSKIGQAAVVGSHRISTKTVDTYVNPAGPTPAGLASVQGQPPAPRVIVLQTLIVDQLFRSALAASPAGLPSQNELRAEHDDVASNISQGAATGDAFDKAYSTQLVALGFRATFFPLFMEANELEFVLAKKNNITTEAQLLALVDKAHQSVSVSPRYGSWNAAQLSLTTDSKSGRPSFLTVGTDTQGSGTASSGQ